MSGENEILSNGRRMMTTGGNCLTSNIIYAAKCTLCDRMGKNNNVYVGKTVNDASQKSHEKNE